MSQLGWETEVAGSLLGWDQEGQEVPLSCRQWAVSLLTPGHSSHPVTASHTGSQFIPSDDFSRRSQLTPSGGLAQLEGCCSRTALVSWRQDALGSFGGSWGWVCFSYW